MSAVYFLEGPNGAIKIGVTGDLPTRVSGLSQGLPGGGKLLCSVAGGRELEAHYLREFAAYRISGEWFRPAPELLALIAQIKRSGTDAVAAGYGDNAMAPKWDQERIAVQDEAAKMIHICGFAPSIAPENKRVQIARAARRLGMSRNRAKSIWYREANIVSAEEYFALLKAAAAYAPRASEGVAVMRILERRVTATLAGLKSAMATMPEARRAPVARKAGTTRADLRRMAARRAA